MLAPSPYQRNITGKLYFLRLLFLLTLGISIALPFIGQGYYLALTLPVLFALLFVAPTGLYIDGSKVEIRHYFVGCLISRIRTFERGNFTVSSHTGTSEQLSHITSTEESPAILEDTFAVYRYHRIVLSKTGNAGIEYKSSLYLKQGELEMIKALERRDLTGYQNG